MSLGHIVEDETHVLVRQRSTDTHVTNGRGHHARRKLMRRHVAASAVCAKAFFAFNAKRTLYCGCIFASWDRRICRVCRQSRICCFVCGGCGRGDSDCGRERHAFLRDYGDREAGARTEEGEQEKRAAHFHLHALPRGNTNLYVRPKVHTFLFPSDLNWRP